MTRTLVIKTRVTSPRAAADQLSTPVLPSSSRPPARSETAIESVMTGIVVVTVALGTEADSRVPSSRSDLPMPLSVGRPGMTGP